MQRKAKFLSIFLISLILYSCANKKHIDSSSFCKRTKKPCLEGKAKIMMQTSRGKIILELDGESSPITAGHFLELINRKAYENTTFHRVIKTPYPFIVQGGDLILNNESNFIPLEIKIKSEEIPRYNFLITNPTEISEIQIIHKRGALAMARSEGINSAKTQFYIALKPLPELDGRYTVFGHVIEGMEAVDSIEKGDKIIRTYLLDNKRK